MDIETINSSPIMNNPNTINNNINTINSSTISANNSSSSSNNNNTNNNTNSNNNNSNTNNTILESKIKILPNTNTNNSNNNNIQCKKNIYRLESEEEPLPIWLLLVFFGFSILVIVFLVYKFPNLSEEHKKLIRLPQSFQDVKVLSDVLSQYTKDNYYIVITTFGVVYTFLQAFSIPGSVFLSFLSGGLFGLKVGFPLVCFVATLGATLSYLISYYIGRNMVRRLFPDKLKLFSESISQRRDNLFNYIIFLRITPFLPNWFINLASPLLDIPISTFALGTFIGIMPATFLAVRAGISIQNISKPTDIFDLKSILTMGILATLSILPTLKPVRNQLDKILNRKKNEIKSN